MARHLPPSGPRLVPQPPVSCVKVTVFPLEFCNMCHSCIRLHAGRTGGDVVDVRETKRVTEGRVMDSRQ